MKILYIHQPFSFIGGGEVFANDVGKTLNIPIHSIVNTKNNKFNFIDISSKLPFLSRCMRNVRSMDYFTFSSLDISDIGEYDVVLSSGSVKSLITPPYIPHFNMVFSTPRTLYDLYHWRRKRMKFGNEWFVLISEFIRNMDTSANNRVDKFISISPIIQRRLEKYYKIKSDIIYPPIDCSKYYNKSSEDYFLFLSRLEPEKRPEEAIDACIKTDQKLIVSGIGSLSKKLQSKYKNNKNIIFSGFVSEENKIDLLSHCKALIFSAINEDFGISVIESLASGKPVIVSNEPDNFPTLLIKNKYGMITDGTSQDISYAIRNMPEFNPKDLMECAKQFDFSIFKERLNERIKFYYDDFNNKFNI